MSKVIEGKGGIIAGVLLVIILGTFCIYLVNEKQEVIETLESSYTRSFYDLIEYMDNVETLLAKVQISNSPEFAAKTLTDIWRKADLAQSSLSQIPITHMTLEKVVQFLNQLSDYSYVLSQSLIDKEKLSEEEFDNLKNYYEKSKIINQTLSELIIDLNAGNISWKELTREENTNFLAQEVSNVSQDSFGGIEENMQDYEGLIYDGPFSDHMTSITPLGLGSGEVSLEDAKRKVYEFVDGNTIKDVQVAEVRESKIPVYTFDITLNDGNKVYVDVSIQGGKVLWCMSNIQISGEKISVEQAKEQAKQFLDSHGIFNMQDTYYISENGMATINFAYKDEEIVCYPDLIKVKVSLTDGSIIGMEAQSYYSSHTDRNYKKRKVTLEEARKKINPDVDVYYEGLALIPTDWKTEVLTYEFKGRVGENDFIVYINTETGREEKIFMIVNTPNGILTV
jgi:germination protein YpeB